MLTYSLGNDCLSSLIEGEVSKAWDGRVRLGFWVPSH